MTAGFWMAPAELVRKKSNDGKVPLPGLEMKSVSPRPLE